MKSDKSFYYSKIIYFLLSLTLFIGFFFNEDSSGSGGFIDDFNNTWPYVELLRENLFVLPSQWVLHTPLHFILLSKVYILIESKYFIRFFYCLFSISVPFLFYLCLKINFPKQNKSNLLTLASLTFIFPSFRSGAIWANDHITAIFFFLLFLIYFLKWIKQPNFKELNINIYLQLIFLALAVYTRQYYALIYIYCMYVYFKKLDFFNFFKLFFIVFIFSIPGFILIYYDPILLNLNFDTKLYNTILLNSSILSLYLIPIYFVIIFFSEEKLETTKKQQYLFILISVTIVLFFSNLFNYNPQIGGGYFLKLSYLLMNNEILFFITSIIGIFLLINIAKDNIDNTIIILLLIFGLSARLIFQKYFEPMFFFILFLMIKSDILKTYLNKIKNIYFLYFYYGIYLITAIINNIYKITKTVI